MCVGSPAASNPSVEHLEPSKARSIRIFFFRDGASAHIIDLMNLLESLNPDQRRAVTHSEGPLLILAGAGSGKTRVLTHRIAYLIAQRSVDPHKILAITFTNKAADEMKERLESLIGPIARGMWVSTFHSACVRILRREIERLGYTRNFTIYDEADRNRLILACLADLDIDSKRFPPSKFAALISDAKNRLTDPESYSDGARNPFGRTVAEVYRLYQERLYRNNALDFDDLIMVTVNLLSAFPSVLESYRERFEHVLVDEYQDTNQAQYQLVKLLAAKSRNVCVVGDDDQSIYGFRGADIRNILNFERDYPDATVIKLEQNYRSTKRILEVANAVVARNQGRKPKALWTSNDEGEMVVRFEAENEHEEAAFVATEIEELVEKGWKYADVAVFYRTNAQSRVLEEAFLRYGVPYRVVGGLRFYERQEIKDVLAYLRAIVNPSDSLSVKRIVNVPKRGLGKAAVAWIDAFSSREGIDFAEAIGRAEDIPQLMPAARKAALSFAAMLLELRELSKDVGLEGTLKALLDRTGYLDMLEEEGTIEAESRAENVKELISVVQEFERDGKKALDEFLAEVSLVSDIDELAESEDAVTLMTVHNAKGLEFPIVFIAGMEEGVFPHVRSLADVGELEEERRLCYVGITRARRKLYLTNASSRNLWGGTSWNAPSRFLREIPAELMVSKERCGSSAEPPHQASETKVEVKVDVSYRVGDRVRHSVFGVGVVAGLGGRDTITVRFDGGEKLLHIGYAPLEKISNGANPSRPA